MQYAFIHIPKCAGMSMTKSIQQTCPDKIAIFGHGCLLERVNKYKQIIILREPVDRFSSSFFYLRSYKINKDSKFTTPDQLIDGLLCFDPLAFKFLKVQPHSHHVNGKEINTDWVFHPQSAWVHNPHIVILYEKLQEGIDELNRLLNIDLKLDRINSRKRTKFSYLQRHLDFINIYYRTDFELYDKYKHYSNILP